MRSEAIEGPEESGRMDTNMNDQARADLNESALYFHKHPTPGKLEIQADRKSVV